MTDIPEPMSMPYEATAAYLAARWERQLRTAAAEIVVLQAELAHRTLQRDNLSTECATAVDHGRRHYRVLVDCAAQRQALEDRLYSVGAALRSSGPDSAKLARIAQLLDPARFKDE